ncbi:hypothetical protein QYE76_059093 [Lolium multiflorum]|uniref:Retrotransposon gag domain-containing protein n=1 Tax=Lolium multiflorum TaxID=4521 RepID=A0AAD8T7U4_LOLMU|nr:hypothetical protein QYE76_059093 [Lolium multiflorum]
MSTTPPSTSEMADGTPVTYEDLTDELKKKWKGFSPDGALDGIDMSAPSEERTRSLRQEINYMVAHSLHRHSENLVNTLERVALRVIQEIMRHQYSPSGPALGTHQGEMPLQSRPPLPFALAAPEVPNSPAFVVYKIGGDPSDCQFLHEAPKEIPHGYMCTYMPDCELSSCSWLELEKQAWLAKYATPANLESTPAASTADQISTILRDQFGMVPKRRTIGYSKPYPDEYELVPLPPKYRLPDFSKFSGSDGSSSIEHFHSEASEAGIADLAQIRQKRGETVAEYIQRFRNLRNRCYSARVTEKEAVELAVVGLASQIKDMASQADYPSLAHMVQKLSAYEQRHPDLYQDKFKRAVVLVEADEDEGSAGDQEVAVAEWTWGATPVSCKWVKPPGPPRGFDFDVTKTEQIFDLLLKEKQLKIPEGLKIPTVQELNGKPYCKWHNSVSHATNNCRVWRQQIQMAIEQGRLIFNQYAMKVDTHPFPAVNMVECTYPEGCQPGSSFSINMVGPGHHSGKDGDEGSCS